MMPSVTQILPPIEFFCTPEQLEAARNDGTEFHFKMELFLSTGDTFNDADVIGAAEVLRENKKYLGEVVQIEKRLESARHKFSGKPDVIFEKAIMDYKRTLGSKKRLALQIAGYHILAVENKIIKPTKKWYVLYRQNGFKLINVYDPLAEDIFLSLVKKYYIDMAVEKYLK